jgi:hypothetical protein
MPVEFGANKLSRPSSTQGAATDFGERVSGPHFERLRHSHMTFAGISFRVAG